jgi:hypothetical protein
MKRAFLVLCLAGAAACVATVAASPDGVFREITKTSGVRMVVNGDVMRLKMIPTMAGGLAFGDFDGDGLPDLYVANGVRRWGKPNTDSCGKLFRNLGRDRFLDVTEKAGIHACGLGVGAYWVDLDGDGKLDLYLTNVGPNAVYFNRGDGTFEEGRDTGLEDPLFSAGAGFLDSDGDGRVDVVVANYLESTPEWEWKQPQFELRLPEDYMGQPSHLFHNEGGRKWRDVTQEAGLAVPPAEMKTLGVAVLDYDGDGKPDLYFVNDRMSNRLFRNKGDGTFEETTAETGAGVLGDHARAGMGVAVGDPTGSGRPSLFVTNFGAEPSSLYLNVEGALFEDAGARSGAGAPGLPYVKWGTHFADFDNDGWPDLYAVGGHLASRIVRTIGHYKSQGSAYVEAGDRSFAQPTTLLKNLGEGRYVEWKDSGDLAGLRMVGRGSAVADIDNDGDLDLAIVNREGPVRLFENVIGSRKSWIRIEPLVSDDRRTVLGTTVRVTFAGRTQTKWFYPSPSYASGTLTDLHFGLGDASVADRVEILWPGGEKQDFQKVPARHVYRIRRGGALEVDARLR